MSQHLHRQPDSRLGKQASHALQPGVQVPAAAVLSETEALPGGSSAVVADGGRTSDGSEWEISVDEIKIGKRIGIGSFGEVCWFCCLGHHCRACRRCRLLKITS